MARVIPTAMQTAILDGSFHPIVLAYIDWPSGAVRVHSGLDVLEWDGADWLGVGDAGFLELPPVSQGLGQETGALLFGGVTDVIDEMLAEDSQGAAVEIWFGVTQARTPAPLVSEPVRVFVGTIDDAGDTIDGDAHQGRLTIISGPSQMSTGSPFHTLEDQQTIDANDTAGRWVRANESNAIAETVKW